MSTMPHKGSKAQNGDGPDEMPDSNIFIHHAEAVWEQRETYGPPGFKGVFVNYYAALCAAFAAIGGMVFGYDQGVVSVVLVMPQFLDRFPRVDGGGAGFWKGLLTAMIELGALIGALNQGWVADKISRRYSIVVAVIFFSIGSILQTASVDYAMLTVGRLIGGIGIGMLSMVAPLYISEISPPEIRGSLLVLEELSIVTGIVIAFWITYGTRHCPPLENCEGFPPTTLESSTNGLIYAQRWPFTRKPVQSGTRHYKGKHLATAPSLSLLLGWTAFGAAAGVGHTSELA
ncbi:MAG: hypothetical protein OHK93_000953 [Ramalina farinacea]|uniref:Major facilitator superfamily (MFS) profile domain-containing protein n=1 Tax=Ramalina farinacea TaxID=258253 RepID=A0AA43QSV8_9LECA|nr:hypothetical protein [Ramalina farinacea]